MPSELTREDVRAIYDQAIGWQRGGRFIHAIRLYELVVESDDPFLTGFSLSALAQCYSSIGRHDLEIESLKRITRLSSERKRLLDPSWLVICYQRTGDFGSAQETVDEVLKLSPNDAPATATKAEVSLLQGNLPLAEEWAGKLRDRAEPSYQVLGRLVRAFALAGQGRQEESRNEFLWVGQFLTSIESVPLGIWDYRDIVPLVNKVGVDAGIADLLLQTMSGKVAFPEFTEKWKGASPDPQLPASPK